MPDQLIQGAGLLGFGMNVVMSTPQDSVTAAIVRPVSGSAQAFTWNGVEYDVPNNVSVTPGFGDNTTVGTVIVGSTRQEFQSKFSARLGVSGSYNAFSGEFNLAFTNESKSQEQYWYAMVEGDFQAYTLLLQEEAAQQLDQAFLSDPDVQAMLKLDSFDPTTRGVFFQVFEKWGTHYVYQAAMGASLQYFTAVSSTYSSSEQTVTSNLQLEYNAVFVSAKVNAGADWEKLGQSWSDDRSVTVMATGGNTALLSALDPSYGDNFGAQFDSWRESVPGQLGVQQYYLRDLSTLFDGANETAVAAALQEYLSAGLSATASFNGTVNPNSLGTSVQVNAELVAPATPIPSPPPQYGGVQLVAVDATTLTVTVNQVWYAAQWDDQATTWPLVVTAGQQAGTECFLLISVFGSLAVSGFPDAQSAAWLQSCGASLEAWMQASQWNCGNDFNVAYAMIGQPNLPVGAAVETFAIDGTAQQITPGYFYANATAPLIPDPAGGAYRFIGASSPGSH